MKKSCLLLLLICIFTFAGNAQTFTRIWKSAYTDSSVAILQINDVAVDSNGNSYLAGYKIFPNGSYYETHLFLMKVNAEGIQKWIRYFNNKFDSIDAATAITLDAKGNIYLTGTRIDTFCDICTYSSKISDIITMKYNGAGDRLWLNRYHDSIYKLASPNDITISAGGTIIVTGSDDIHALVEKINNNGKTIWIKKLNDVVTNTACFDNENNIIVGGSSDPDHIYQTDKPMVMKLSSAGNILWSNIYDEYEKNGRIYFVACDSLNSIYANGQTDTIAFYNNPRIITIKYNSAGQQKWFRKEENESNILAHYEGDFKLDASGNSYITGYVHLSSINDDWLVAKYNSFGLKQWITHYDDSVHGYDRTIGLAVNKNGVTYVTGYSLGKNSNYNITTIAYDIYGNELAADIFKNHSLASGIGLDKAGNIYVSGEIGFYNNPYPSLIVIKYGTMQTGLSKIPSLKIISDLKLFPNPVSNIINMIFTTSTPAKNYNLVINDLSGNVILSKQLSSNEKIISTDIDVSRLKQGIYTVSISDGVNAVSKTFIKE